MPGLHFPHIKSSGEGQPMAGAAAFWSHLRPKLFRSSRSLFSVNASHQGSPNTWFPPSRYSARAETEAKPPPCGGVILSFGWEASLADFCSDSIDHNHVTQPPAAAGRWGGGGLGLKGFACCSQLWGKAREKGLRTEATATGGVPRCTVLEVLELSGQCRELPRICYEFLFTLSLSLDGN